MKGGMINLTCHKYGHFSWGCKANIECYNCHKYGHFSWKCKSNVEEKFNGASNSDKKDDKNLWYLDNGASNHMGGYKEKFVELEEEAKGNVSRSMEWSEAKS